MNFIVTCWIRIRLLVLVLFRRKQIESDLHHELTLHVDLLADQKIAEGMSPTEARRSALLEFGGVDHTAERVRDVWFGMWIERVGREIRLCVRSFIRDPVFAGVAVLTLGLGVAASTSVFTVISSAVLRPLPVSAPDRLAHLFLGDRRFWSHPLWEEIQRGSGQFDGAFASSRTNFDVAVSGESRFVEGLWASGGFFDALGVQPLLGRVFTEADDRRGCGVAGPVVVISHRMWRNHFGGDAGVIGGTLPLNGVSFTVIGVTPLEFFGPTVGRTFDALVPLGCEALVRGDGSQLDNPWNTWLNITLRLRPDQSFAEATTVVQAWQPAIREATRLPRMGRGYLREPMALLPAGGGGASTLWQRYRTSLLALLAIAGLLLMVTCANVANLMLARGVARRREIATRLALGATRSQIARLVLLEGVLVSVAGGVVGLTVSRWVTGLLVLGLSQRAGEAFLEVSPDWRIAAFTLGVSAVATLLFGAGPAIRTGLVPPRAVLAEQGRLAHSSGRVAPDRAVLVVQVAVSLVLVVTAGLFMRTFTTLAGLHAGVDRDRVLLVTPHAFGEAAATSGADRLRRYERIREAVRGIPGVSYAAVSFPTPLSPNMWRTGLDAADAPGLPDEQRRIVSTMVSPDWFAAYGVPVMRGRDFRGDDMTATRPVAIVNEAFVDRFMADDADPLGRTFGLWHDPDRRYVIVGVVGNVAYASLRDPIGPAVYVPLGLGGELAPIVGSSSIYTALSGIWVVGVRAERGSPAALTGSVVAAIREVDPTLTSEARTLAAQIEGTLRQERLTAIVAGLFGGLALLLAAVGLYGVTLLTMRRRRVEIGIRMALGATRGRVLGGAILRVGLLVGGGVAIGGVASLVVGRSLGTLLYGLEPHDPATLAVAAGVLMLAGVGAGLAAAVPAVRVEPSQLLRQQ
ncbi:MAG: ADOP family duplicated permease [Gammaproteobacteria bacterium]|nr:ADOP family duplicated permease [Gammaproteobacteria bacterium]